MRKEHDNSLTHELVAEQHIVTMHQQQSQRHQLYHDQNILPYLQTIRTVSIVSHYNHSYES
jgi:hypothetical protein